MAGRATMIKGLSGATVWSEDVNSLPPFYRDVPSPFEEA
jgi:hypothetical protein